MSSHHILISQQPFSWTHPLDLLSKIIEILETKPLLSLGSLTFDTKGIALKLYYPAFPLFELNSDLWFSLRIDFEDLALISIGHSKYGQIIPLQSKSYTTNLETEISMVLTMIHKLANMDLQSLKTLIQSNTDESRYVQLINRYGQ